MKTKSSTTTVRCTTGRTACVDSYGVVRVYDDVAGHYTVCHTLTPGQERYVRSRCAWGAVVR